jgi:hypothetical protein
VDNGADPTLGALVLSPPEQGTRIRFVDIPPDTAEFLASADSKMHEAFSQIGEAAASTVQADSPHPLMHRTESVDYGIVIEGEMTLVLERRSRPEARQRGGAAWHQPCLGQSLGQALPHAVCPGGWQYDPAIAAQLAKGNAA